MEKMADKTKNARIRYLIYANEKDGRVVINTIEGLMVAKLDEIILQPTEGLLYDLNRDRATVSAFLDDPKWINDYACALVIGALKDKIDQLEVKLKEATNGN
jgi:hypothetical protein